jgi:hypothetical protein
MHGTFGKGHVVEFPYSDELWARLLEFSERLRQIQDELIALSKREDFVEMFLTSKFPLLGSGEGDGGSES